MHRHLLLGGLLALTAPCSQVHAVDGVIEINQARAEKGGITSADTPGLPVTLSASPTISDLRPPTSFRLTGSLSHSLAGDVIEIVSPNITLDLNGFTILCFLGPCTGKAVTSTQANVTVMNGTLRGFAVGAELSGSGARFENLRAIANEVGLRANNYCLARNNVVTGNTGSGMEVGSGCIVTGNTSSDNGGDGICTLGGSNVIGNTVRDNTLFGLNLSAETGYSQNVIGDNAGGTVSGGVSTGDNVCEGSTTCP